MVIQTHFQANAFTRPQRSRSSGSIQFLKEMKEMMTKLVYIAFSSWSFVFGTIC
jgi:hypothetical protein